MDTAIEAMYSMMDEIYGEGTRTLPSKKIVEITPIYAPSLTKVIGGGGSGGNDDPLVYVVNFDNNSGFSVLSTHPAVENVIALGDSGNLKAIYFTQAVSACAEDKCEVCATAEPEELDKDYEPDDEPGYDYNDASYASAFVKTPFTVTSANCSIPHPVIDLTAQLTISRLIIEYVWTTVQKYVRGWLSPHENLGGQNYWSSWVSTQGIPPMIMTKWHQNSPYNMFCYTGGLEKAVAGCVPVAVAQITAYHKRNLPGKWASINKMGVWDVAREKWYTGNNIEQAEVAEFVKSVGVACKAEYGVKTTSSTLSKAKKGMKSLGYTNVKKHKYDPYIIENRLKCGCPVYIQGSSSSSAHAWVIDGLMRQRRTSLANGSIQVRTLFHCNWGWQGRYDGYFTSSVFNVTDGPHFNNPNLGETRSDGNYNYNHHLKIITYNRPFFSN